MSTRTRFEKEAKGNSEMAYFHRKFDYRTRDRMDFLKHTFTLLPLQIQIRPYLRNFLRTTQRAKYSKFYVTSREGQLDFPRKAKKKENPI